VVEEIIENADADPDIIPLTEGSNNVKTKLCVLI